MTRLCFWGSIAKICVLWDIWEAFVTYGSCWALFFLVLAEMKIFISLFVPMLDSVMGSRVIGKDY